MIRKGNKMAKENKYSNDCFFEIDPIQYNRTNKNCITVPDMIKISAPNIIKPKKPLTRPGLIHAIKIIKEPAKANFFEYKILQKLTPDFINRNHKLYNFAFYEWEQSGIRIKIPFEFGLYEVEKMIIFDFLCRQKPVQSKIFQIVDSICKKALLFNIKIVLK